MRELRDFDIILNDVVVAVVAAPGPDLARRTALANGIRGHIIVKPHIPT